jgi:hypothetical protein
MAPTSTVAAATVAAATARTPSPAPNVSSTPTTATTDPKPVPTPTRGKGRLLSSDGPRRSERKRQRGEGLSPSELGDGWVGTNPLNAAKLPGLRLQDSNQDPKIRCDEHRQYVRIPQSGETMPPLTGQPLIQATNYLKELKLWTKEEPTLQPAVEQFESMISGNKFVANEFWNMPSRNQQSMADDQASRKLGGCLGKSIYHERRKKLFSNSAKGRKLNTHSEVEIRQAYQLKQEDMRTPYPPKLKGVSGPHHFRQQVIETIVTYSKEEIVLYIPAAEDKSAYQLSPSIMVTKSEDQQQKNGRLCIDLKQANEPAKRVFAQPSFPKATQNACSMLSTLDLCSLVDAKKGYNQLALAKESAKLQSFTVQRDLYDEAMTQLQRPLSNPATHWILTVQGKEVVAMMPTCLQFGSAPSRALFEREFQQPLRHLRTSYGLRAASQVDDLLILENQGPAASFLRIAMIVSIYHFTGWQLHLSGKKAQGLWPAAFADFNGSRFVPELMHHFIPPPRARMVQKATQELSQELRNGKTVDNRQIAVVIGQNRACHAHWPTPLWLAELQEALSKSLAAAGKISTTSDPYDSIFKGFTARQMRHLKACAQYKDLGSPVRSHGPPRLTATADASEHSFGGEATDHDTNETFTISAPLLRKEQEQWHTHKEGIAVYQLAQTAIEHFQIKEPIMRPRPMNLQSDNQAVVANGNRPKGKVRMVTPMLKARIKMVAAGLIPKVTYVPKEYMDIETRIDEFGRIQYTQDDLGLMQRVLMPALVALDPNWSSRNWIDALACRATHQPWCQEWIGRWPNHDALPQPDFLS